ncbi:MAG: 4-(cytidine 5'-diphospho)-2-C-methyl-D-erythritol kinase [Ferrovum sp. 37-45-19]|jgi:4-diphosphocytidyl-2-C-methyl-D-erythritol kinase|uniref:4-(cytidine 5'-diphospho)-2-C-methyl-D-erythritol kinase n=1 Tax=Ferrovum sp. JA12 TaxID=1356299 RepID=UPI0007027DE6|nr:4-(cytidine 5'-diphospho)-2-C-methyl-D-erythritol kinase [Ferrovum sp. JA12]OYV80545.1 MAG: 4-(cytidine 5'-diphospho)-2-C-methyl-D-erythritol kinase [Ferrovum sp. 21-44-67]OYV94860.1 MAG: 4-(cytidine 5'-diphospho)-2-C-methyl-D-erythritol kinase [Ferrovum sp. 37-45-19]OZB34108.1 MAG: 4-(cytidine 5'-diphospho)-2-C-methyl-D-erythritol kinase [Ferrovum sp. 34-44-207]HQT81007.1 4-(cytidine 5'-diphospho)-2-C-methyl-D-erythritol kinase [Ferrovaceae bacterium]KRH79268.1 4-diphosphocytidyl-2-C-methy
MVSQTLSVLAPAKLNLFLHVIGQRQDGYHLLQSLMTFVDFNDEINLELRLDGLIRRVGHYSIPEDQDLVIKAARLLQSYTKSTCGVDISYNKKIPMGAGLGGGSSDAASVLIGLNQLWKIAVSRRELAEVALTLGADVPFFIGGESAFVEGIGEIVTPLSLPPRWFMVLNPGIGVSTAEVFRDSELTRDSQPVKMSNFSGTFGRNDLQPVVEKRIPEVKRLLNWLKQWGDARMSGSGTSCFVAFDREEEAYQAWLVKPSEWSGFVARSMNCHPLREWL